MQEDSRTQHAHSEGDAEANVTDEWLLSIGFEWSAVYFGAKNEVRREMLIYWGANGHSDLCWWENNLWLYYPGSIVPVRTVLRASWTRDDVLKVGNAIGFELRQ